MYPRWPDSLSSICISYIADNMARYEDSLRFAPRTIKDKLFTIAYRRRNVLQNESLLRALLHSRTETVYFGNCERVTDEMILAVRVCRNLKEFSMKGSNAVSKAAFARLIASVSRLQCLTTEECSFVDDAMVRLFVKLCPMLRTVNVKKCNITNSSFEELGKLKLQALNAVGFEVSDAAVDRFIGNNCGETIRELIVTNCSEASSQNLLKKCAKLHTFVNSGSVGPVMMVHKHLCGRYPSSYKIFSNAPGI